MARCVRGPRKSAAARPREAAVDVAAAIGRGAIPSAPTKDAGGVTPARATASGTGDAVMARMTGTHAAAHAPARDANLFRTVLGWFRPSDGTSGHRYRLPTYTAVMPSALPHAIAAAPPFDDSIASRGPSGRSRAIRASPVRAAHPGALPCCASTDSRIDLKPSRWMWICRRGDLGAGGTTTAKTCEKVPASPPERSTPA